jgi:hypothetical protein
VHDARVEKAVQQVDQQIHHDDNYRRHEKDAQQHVGITLEERIEHQTSEAWPAEYGLDWIPASVTTGRIALGTACFHAIAPSGNPFARAATMYSSPDTSSIDVRITRVYSAR